MAEVWFYSKIAPRISTVQWVLHVQLLAIWLREIPAKRGQAIPQGHKLHQLYASLVNILGMGSATIARQGLCAKITQAWNILFTLIQKVGMNVPQVIIVRKVALHQ